ncbi:DNA-binding response regulator [Marinicella pacifica]|uniref:DNA-binding response regulator n=1 Tax=Marinicella pacifica TaxID=1171543 RepID=A0A917CH99_9GAMM|nr:response regulator [Marinicella pacifica]GGF89004.1 DNA-binding response regulator [Marinicella pacifica]
MNKHILIVEDEAPLAELMADYLKRSQLDTTIINHGDDVIRWLKKNSPAVILMDLMLPGQDGLELTKTIREFSQVPIIITTAKVSEIDRLMGLEIGADDYVCKPYSPRELVARVQVQLRRHNSQPIATDLTLDDAQISAHIQQKSVQFTVVEFNLLKTLYQHTGQVMSRDQLMNQAYQDYRIISDRTIDSHIKKIRKKLKTIDDHDYIQSIYGLGYQFVSK